jgi:hypothetical protein
MLMTRASMFSLTVENLVIREGESPHFKEDGLLEICWQGARPIAMLPPSCGKCRIDGGALNVNEASAIVWRAGACAYTRAQPRQPSIADRQAAGTCQSALL